MSSVWSVDNFYAGGNSVLSDSVQEGFDGGRPDEESWLFWPGGKISKFCSYNTR